MQAGSPVRPAAWLLLSCALIVLAWWLPNQARDPVPGVRAARFNSLSYAAYRPGESPLNNRFPTAAEVDQDLADLAPITRAIRSYATLEGAYELPALARKHGLKLWQGIWLGGDRAKNQREMAAAIRYAHDYPDVIERVIVGNEVLLRRDLPPAELIADIDSVRAAVKQPVAYADVSDFWDQFPEVAPHVDLVLVHLLPYWEDHPIGIGHAVDAVGKVYQHFVAKFPGKQIVIGETGWPSRGRQRRDAVPGRLNEARFLRAFIGLSEAQHFDYNFIEAFDQDWKYENEGIVGASWGILSAERGAKIPVSGALREDPLWARHAAVSIVFGLMLCWFTMSCGGRTLSAFTLCLAMTLGAALGLAQADAAPVLYDPHVRLAAAVNLCGQALLAALLMLRAAGAVAPAPERGGAAATARVLALLRFRRMPLDGVFEDLRFVFSWTAAVLQTLLVFDPRYREFALPSFAVPLLAAVMQLAEDETSRGQREEGIVAFVLTVGALASMVQEGVLNTQAWAWNASVILLSLPLWQRFFRKRKDSSFSSEKEHLHAISMASAKHRHVPRPSRFAAYMATSAIL